MRKLKYGEGGRYWNVGLSEWGQLRATLRQLNKLQMLTGRSYRGKGLTRDDALELIEAAMNEREASKEGLSSMAEQLFGGLYKRAIDSANAAGAKWLNENPEVLFAVEDPETKEKIGVHGTIGRAWITWPKRGTDLYKWLVDHMYDGQKKELRVEHYYTDRLEGELQLACETAALEVFRRSGANVGDINVMYRTENISRYSQVPQPMFLG